MFNLDASGVRCASLDASMPFMKGKLASAQQLSKFHKKEKAVDDYCPAGLELEII